MNNNISLDTVWMYWEQGFKNAPELVKFCKKSWEKYADNKIIFLDKDKLEDYLPKDEIEPLFDKGVHIQIRSDLIRLKLLLRYGGVWTDSTVFCSEDYHSWLLKEIHYFPVWRPKRDRLIANWLVFSKPGDQILKLIHKHLWDIVVKKKYRVWEDTDSKILKNFRKWTRSYFKRAYRLHGADEYAEVISLFSRMPLIRLFSGYPYLVFHYTFAYINWKSGGKKDKKDNISGKDSIALQQYLRVEKGDSKEKILSIVAKSPVHKLAHSMEINKKVLNLLGSPRSQSLIE